MEKFPHRYQVEASAETAGNVKISSHGLPSLARHQCNSEAQVTSGPQRPFS